MINIWKSDELWDCSIVKDISGHRVRFYVFWEYENDPKTSIDVLDVSNMRWRNIFTSLSKTKLEPIELKNGDLIEEHFNSFLRDANSVSDLLFKGEYSAPINLFKPRSFCASRAESYRLIRGEIVRLTIQGGDSEQDIPLAKIERWDGNSASWELRNLVPVIDIGANDLCRNGLNEKDFKAPMNCLIDKYIAKVLNPTAVVDHFKYVKLMGWEFTRCSIVNGNQIYFTAQVPYDEHCYNAHASVGKKYPDDSSLYMTSLSNIGYDLEAGRDPEAKDFEIPIRNLTDQFYSM